MKQEKLSSLPEATLCGVWSPAEWLMKKPLALPGWQDASQQHHFLQGSQFHQDPYLQPAVGITTSLVRRVQLPGTNHLNGSWTRRIWYWGTLQCYWELVPEFIWLGYFCLQGTSTGLDRARTGNPGSHCGWTCNLDLCQQGHLAEVSG